MPVGVFVLTGFHYLSKLQCTLQHLGWNYIFNTLTPRPNGRYFADDIFKCIILNENAWISLNISLNFVPKVRINNIPALAQIMAWRLPGDKPLSEPMMVKLPTHICVTRPQWVNSLATEHELMKSVSIWPCNIEIAGYGGEITWRLLLGILSSHSCHVITTPLVTGYL